MRVDCSGFPQIPSATCTGLAPAAEKLLASANWLWVSGGKTCAGGLEGDQAATAARALREAQGLASKKLPPLERALLQNAALKLLSCGAGAEPKARAEIVRNAKPLLKALALSPEEIQNLPSTTPELTAWLGDANAWQRGTVRSHLHEASDGFAATVQRVKHADDYASIARLILVDTRGELHVTDVISKVMLRRGTADNLRACIATLDANSAHCGTAQLRPVPEEAAQLAIQQKPGAPPCRACHFAGHANTPVFGPTAGIAPDAVNLDTARDPLSHALAE
jgi:hypothetical protein